MIYVCVWLVIIALYFCIKKKKFALKISEKLFIRIILLISTANLIACGIEIKQFFEEEVKGVSQIQRDSYEGFNKQETYTVEIGDEKEEVLDIQISPRIYAGKKLEKLFQEALLALDEIIVGDNESADYIEQNVILPTQMENYPFSITWELSRYDVMDLSGNLIQEKLAILDEDSDGVLVTVTGYLQYEEEKRTYQKELRLYASKKTEDAKVSIQSIVENIDQNSREEAYLKLPKKWNGKTLVWKKEKTVSSVYLLFFSIVISGLLVLDEKQKEGDKKQKRQEEMIKDYPEIISQLTLLLGAGMTAKSAWKKMAEDYSWQKRVSGKSREAYEEMLYTWQEMQSGIPETECYERFGRRCELLPYIKLGALLAQNLRKGARGIADVLRMEAAEAMDERRNRAKRLGEEAGTKLLVPMVIMLVVVLAIVVVSAFWAASM